MSRSMAMHSFPVCCVAWCGNSERDNRYTFYSIPADERCEAWVKYTQRLELLHLPKAEVAGKRFLCSAHFVDEDFRDKERMVLKSTAVPSAPDSSVEDVQCNSPVLDEGLQSTDKSLRPQPAQWSRSVLRVNQTSVEIPAAPSSQNTQLKEPAAPPTSPPLCLPRNRVPEIPYFARRSGEAAYGEACCARWCGNSPNTTDCSFYRFPKDDRRFKWIYYANRPELKDLPLDRLYEKRLCSSHFTPDAYSSKHKIRLKKTACPSALVTNPAVKHLVHEEFFCAKSRRFAGATKSASSSSSEAAVCHPSRKIPPSDMHSTEGDAVHSKNHDEVTTSSEAPSSKSATTTATGKPFVAIAMKAPAPPVPQMMTMKHFVNLSLPITFIASKPESASSQSIIPLAPGIFYCSRNVQKSVSHSPGEKPCEVEMLGNQDTDAIENKEESMDVPFYYADSPGSLYSSVIETSSTTVALQTEESNMEASSFNVLFCCWNCEGASTQVSHKPADMPKSPKWTISYIKYS